MLFRSMRRAMCHVHRRGVKVPRLHRLVPTMIYLLCETYRELTKAKALFQPCLKRKEVRFRETLERCFGRLHETHFKAWATIAGPLDFQLYNTDGCHH